MCKDIEKYVNECENCRKANKSGQRKVPMVEMSLTTEPEPFECVALI